MLEVKEQGKGKKKKAEEREMDRIFATRPPVDHITSTHCSKAQVELFLPNTHFHVKVNLPHPAHGNL